MDWITSDTHFWHNNILKFPSSKKYRGDLYETREEMNDAMIKIWNSQVGEDDHVFHLGDFAIVYGKKIPGMTMEILSQLNGRITLLMGNHDHRDTRKVFEEMSHKVLDYKELKHDDNKIVMSHYPFGSWNKAHHGSVMLHGHSHGSYRSPGGRILDVGWCVHGRLLTLNEAYRMAMEKEIYSADHYDEKS